MENNSSSETEIVRINFYQFGESVVDCSKILKSHCYYAKHSNKKIQLLIPKDYKPLLDLQKEVSVIRSIYFELFIDTFDNQYYIKERALTDGISIRIV